VRPAGRKIVAAALAPVLLGLGLLAAAIVTRSPDAGARAVAAQTLLVAPAGPGDVTISYSGSSDVCNGEFSAGSFNDCSPHAVTPGLTVTLEAAPHAKEDSREYTFARWSAEECWETNPCKLVMPDGPMSVAAFFTPAEVRVDVDSTTDTPQVTGTVKVGGETIGTIDCRHNGDVGTCGGWYPFGAEVTLEAKGDGFRYWHRYCETAERVCKFIAGGYAWINAEWDDPHGDDIPEKIRSYVTVSIAGSGASGAVVTSSKSGIADESINCPGRCTAQFQFGEPVKLTAGGTAEVTGWGRACSATAKTCTIAAGSYNPVRVTFAAGAQTTTAQTTTAQTTTVRETTTVTTGATTRTVRTTTNSGTPLAQLAKVGFVARRRGTTLAATIYVARAAKGQALLLQRSKKLASWRLSLAKGRNNLRLNLARKPRKGWYVLRVRLADRDGNGVVLNRNVRAR
jgi:Divergent InlB B-repeat domain